MKCEDCGAAMYVSGGSPKEGLDYECPNLCLFKKDLETAPDLAKLVTPYLNHCWNCGAHIDSEVCTPDPPYYYNCDACGVSLRGHSFFGEGGLGDLAKKRERLRSWRTHT